MNIQVLFLGPSRTFAGTDSAEVAIAEGSDVAALRQALSDRFGSLAPALPTARFAAQLSLPLRERASHAPSRAKCNATRTPTRRSITMKPRVPVSERLQLRFPIRPTSEM